MLIDIELRLSGKIIDGKGFKTHHLSGQCFKDREWLLAHSGNQTFEDKIFLLLDKVNQLIVNREIEILQNIIKFTPWYKKISLGYHLHNHKQKKLIEERKKEYGMQ